MITNNPDLNFIDICEVWRTYVYPDGYELTINYPIALDTTTSKSGSHRLVDASGISHFVKSGWRHLYWKVPTGEPNFVF